MRRQIPELKADAALADSQDNDADRSARYLATFPCGLLFCINGLCCHEYWRTTTQKRHNLILWQNLEGIEKVSSGDDYCSLKNHAHLLRLLLLPCLWRVGAMILGRKFI
jgi:hypothetical protein